MHDDGEQAVAIKEAVASLLVGEDAEFSHCSLDKKKTGENVPGTWKPSLRKTNYFISWAARKVKHTKRSRQWRSPNLRASP